MSTAQALAFADADMLSELDRCAATELDTLEFGVTGFDDALAGGPALDTTLDCVLTLRMRPVKVKLRLLAAPGGSMRYVLIQRPA